MDRTRPILGLGLLTLALVAMLAACSADPGPRARSDDAAARPAASAVEEPALRATEGEDAARLATAPEPSTPASMDSPASDDTTAETDHEAAAGFQADSDAADADVPPAESPAPTPMPAAPAEEARARRVGLQAGHWQSQELPAELAALRGSTGTAGGGVPEWKLNLDVSRKVALLLQQSGLAVDVLPATVPPSYDADVFVALHADGDASGRLSGFKLARGRRSALAEVEDRLIAAITQEYQAATGLRVDSAVSRNMTGYYAFSFRQFQHAVAPTTPAVILEMGFMTNASDLRLLLGTQDRVAEGVARGILRFLETQSG